jgi:hypothetical protein
MLRRRARLGLRAISLLSVTFLASHCAGGSAGSATRTPEPAGNGAPTLKGYDSSGNASECAAPREDCPATKADPDFIDQCRLSGYRVLRCGCDERCAGKLKQQKDFYDASGKVQPCAPELSGCTPPETSAKFQDACNDAHHKLVICGCEWLCNGPLGPASSSAE